MKRSPAAVLFETEADQDRVSVSQKRDQIICSNGKRNLVCQRCSLTPQVTANIKKRGFRMVSNSRAWGFIHNQSDRKVCWFGKFSLKKHQKFDRRINGVESERSTTKDPHQSNLVKETSLRNARFNVKKDVCMLKTIKYPQPSRNPQSIVQSEPSNPPKIHAICTVSTKRSRTMSLNMSRTNFCVKMCQIFLHLKRMQIHAENSWMRPIVSHVKTNFTEKNNRFSLRMFVITL